MLRRCDLGRLTRRPRQEAFAWPFPHQGNQAEYERKQCGKAQKGGGGAVLSQEIAAHCGRRSDPEDRPAAHIGIGLGAFWLLQNINREPIHSDILKRGRKIAREGQRQENAKLICAGGQERAH